MSPMTEMTWKVKKICVVSTSQLVLKIDDHGVRQLSSVIGLPNLKRTPLPLTALHGTADTKCRNVACELCANVAEALSAWSRESKRCEHAESSERNKPHDN